MRELGRQLEPFDQLVYLALAAELPTEGIDIGSIDGLAHHIADAHAVRAKAPEIADALRRIQATGLLESDDGVLWLHGMLDDNPFLNPSNPNHRKNVAKWVSQLPPSKTTEAFKAAYSNWFPPGEVDRGPSDAISHTIGDGIPDAIAEPMPDQRGTNSEERVTSNKASSSSGRLTTGGLRERLLSDNDRAAFDAVVIAAGSRSRSWIEEMRGSLEGMPGHAHVTAEQLGQALREFVANGAIERPNLKLFRGYLRHARPSASSTTSRSAPRGGVGARSFANAMTALEMIP